METRRTIFEGYQVVGSGDAGQVVTSCYYATAAACESLKRLLFGVAQDCNVRQHQCLTVKLGEYSRCDHLKFVVRLQEQYQKPAVRRQKSTGIIVSTLGREIHTHRMHRQARRVENFFVLFDPLKRTKKFS